MQGHIQVERIALVDCRRQTGDFSDDFPDRNKRIRDQVMESLAVGKLYLLCSGRTVQYFGEDGPARHPGVVVAELVVAGAVSDHGLRVALASSVKMIFGSGRVTAVEDDRPSLGRIGQLCICLTIVEYLELDPQWVEDHFDAGERHECQCDPADPQRVVPQLFPLPDKSE